MSPVPRIGVSIAQNVLACREQFHQNRLVEQVVPSNPGYQETLRAANDYFASAGGGGADAQGRAIAYIASRSRPSPPIGPISTCSSH